MSAKSLLFYSLKVKLDEIKNPNNIYFINTFYAVFCSDKRKSDG